MRIEIRNNVQAFTILDAPALDPITVVLHDHGDGRGRMVVSCFDEAWTAYWGAMGRSLIGFISTRTPEYLSGCLRGRSDTEEAYMQRISTAIIAAMNSKTEDSPAEGAEP